MKKLAVITTHPIQYYAPLFQMLAARGNVQVRVFYTWGADVLNNKYDPGFKRVVEWDIPLLEGYEYEFVENIAADKGSHHFKGIDNPSLIEQVSKWQPDVLFVIGWSYRSHLKALHHFKNKIPVLFRGDSTLLDEQPGFSVKKIARRVVLSWIYMHIDKALYVGTNNKAYYKKFGLRDNRLVYAPHAIDNTRFSDDEATKETKAAEWRAQLGIKQTDTVFLFAGKLEPKKAPELLLEAFIKINAPGTHLIFAGNGELEEQLKAAAAPHPNIHFIGFQNQGSMPVVYRLGDVFVLPSRGPDETWGLAINEAMACGRAVIASDKCGGAIDLVDNGVNGHIFKSGSLDDLIIVLNNCLSGKNMLAEMGNQSRQKINLFTFGQIVEAIERCVQ